MERAIPTMPASDHPQAELSKLHQMVATMVQGFSLRNLSTWIMNGVTKERSIELRKLVPELLQARGNAEPWFDFSFGVGRYYVVSNLKMRMQV